MLTKILVTGASGLLGANFLKIVQKTGCEVVGIFHHHPIFIPGISTIQTDLSQYHEVRTLISRFKPRHILHCAAMTNVDWCEAHPQETWRINVDVSRNLALEAHNCSSKLIYISTDSVFDGTKGSYTEEDLPNPINVYAKSKLAAEKMVLDVSKENLVIRTNIYGWNFQNKYSLAEWVLDRLEAGQKVPGFYDVLFSPILVNDLSRIILDMIDLDLKGIYHVAGSEPCSKYDFAREIARAFSLDTSLVHAISIDDFAFLAQRPRNTSLRVHKVHEALGRKIPTIQSGLLKFKALRMAGYVEELKNSQQS